MGNGLVFKGVALVLMLGTLVACAAGTAKGQNPAQGASPPPRPVTAGNGIQPSESHLGYWQYRGAPLLLAGASATDHLFIGDTPSQDGAGVVNLSAHLRAIAAVGGNYVRNTMSQRAPDLQWRPHKRLADGRFDLTQWNERYWQRLDDFLGWTRDLDIIVQIELFDPWDFSGADFVTWPGSAWRPANNVNYTEAGSGLPNAWAFAPWMAQPSGRRENPFFWTLPGLANHNPKLLALQEAFVDKVLSIALAYDHVLYCIDNEFSGDPAWPEYWAQFIRTRAAARGRAVSIGEMWSRDQLETSGFPDRYALGDVLDFADVSQVNHLEGQNHYNRALSVWRHLRAAGDFRPINAVKVYKAGAPGVESFWRLLLAGSGAVRFHRAIPTEPAGAGNGFNREAQASLRAVRHVASRVNFWDLEPRPDLVGDPKDNSAFVAARPGRAYVVFLPGGGPAGLDLRGVQGRFSVEWVDVASGTPRPAGEIAGGEVALLRAPGRGAWVATIVR